MMRASLGSRLLAPGRIISKGVRHLSMHARRRMKPFAEWPGWRAARERRRRLMFHGLPLRLPLHRLKSEVRACPGCGSASIRVLEPIQLDLPIDESRIGFASGCTSCGLVFANPMPRQETLDAFYAPDGHWGRDHRQSDPVFERRAQRFFAGQRKVNQLRRARHVILDALQPFIPVSEPPAGAAVLDYGCGDGKLLNGLQEAGWRTYGVEPSSDVAFLRHERVEVLPSDPSFDLILLHHVLEHVPHPLDLLTRLVATLRPGGIMFISVPRLDTLPEHGDFKYCINGRTHIVCFSEICLRELLRRAGVEPVAALLSAELDAQLSQGRPLRLRLVARKTDACPAPAPDPLRAAIRALHAYRRRTANASWLERYLPVRVRARWMDRDYRLRVSDSASAA